MKWRRLVAVAVLLLMLPPLPLLGDAAADSGPEWTELHPERMPSGRHHHAMAHDSESDRIVLFGGSEGLWPNNETWAYDRDANRWKNMRPATRPSDRVWHAMAYDSESDRVVLFGGSHSGTSSDETWAYDLNANTWTRMSPALRPPGRTGHGMVYDAESDRVILYGGSTSSGYLGDTWAYDLNSDTWTRMNPTDQPPDQDFALAYDSRADRVILYYGDRQTWAYDFNEDRWENRVASVIPPLHHMQMAYDPFGDRTILVGFLADDAETWVYAYDENEWTDLLSAARPPYRGSFAMAYDVESEAVILFGGLTPDGNLSDTWALEYRVADAAAPWWVLVAVPAAVAGVVAVSAALYRRRRKRAVAEREDDSP